MIFLDIIRWIFTVITIAIAVGFAYAFYKAWHFHPRFKAESEKTRKIQTLRDAVMKERWHAIAGKFSLGTSDATRVAIIEADALADTALKGMGIAGEHLADRLSNLDPEDMTTINRVWRAHRMRNDLVHTPGFVLSPSDAKLAMSDYEAFLKELEVL